MKPSERDVLDVATLGTVRIAVDGTLHVAFDRADFAGGDPQVAMARAQADARVCRVALHALLAEDVAYEVGRAIAAELYGRPSESFTPEEAADAIVDLVVLYDHPQSARAQRAGIVAAVLRLSPVIPPVIACLVEDVLEAMDDGERLLWGEPASGRRGGSGKRGFHSRWFAYEVHYQMGRLARSRDYAIWIVAGVWRGETTPPANAEEPTLRWRRSYRALQELLKQGEERLGPVELAEARAAGEAVYRGEVPEARAMRKRAEAIKVWPYALLGRKRYPRG